MSDDPDDDTAEENKEEEKEEEEESAEDADDADDADDGDDGEDGEESKKGGKGKLIAIIAAALVVLLGAGGGGAYFFGLFDSLLEKKGGSRIAVIELGAPVIHELPMIRADLKTGRCRSPLLRTVFAVQLGSIDLPRLKSMGILIEDAVRTHLRDQERQDLVGKAGTDKLRTDITNIINKLIAPARIHALIFKEFLVQ